MHNCKLTKDGLIDLVLDELPSAEAEQLLSELNDCEVCREEYATLRNTWRVSGQALQSLRPTENFWPGYHARLHGKLIAHLQMEKERASPPLEPMRRPWNSPLWQRIRSALVTQTVSLRSMAWKLATTSVRVPVPVALALMLLFGISVFTLLPRGPVNAALPTQLLSMEPRIINVPVVQEKVVTRVVYVEKKGRGSRGGAREGSRPSSLSDSVARARSDASVKAAMSLVDFKPTDQIKLTITKGSDRNEK